MADSQGRFVWYELMSTDVPAARAFYEKVVGWTTADAQMPGMEYWMFNYDGQQVAGLMELPGEARDMGTPPSWIGYIGVNDVNAAAEAVSANGGTVYRAPADIPNVGQFAIVADPGGAVFALFKSANPDQEAAMDQTASGHIGWHELYSGDQERAFDFYSRVFGWEKKQAMDMGDMGMYQTFDTAGSGDTMLGGMMNKPPSMPVAAWNYYFNVGNSDDTAERVKSAGGQIMMGPEQVPGGSFVLGCTDPQGAAFALMGSR